MPFRRVGVRRGKRPDRCSCTAPSTTAPRAPTPAAASLPKDGVVRILRESKGRGGKGVSLIAGLPLGQSELAALASELKRQCGTGGTVRGDVIEIQGDFRERLKAELVKRGYTVKLAGG
jgi:translation initiation factor 1